MILKSFRLHYMSMYHTAFQRHIRGAAGSFGWNMLELKPTDSARLSTILWPACLEVKRLGPGPFLIPLCHELAYPFVAKTMQQFNWS